MLKGGKTGWPPGLLQDDCRALHKWFASRLDARAVVRKGLEMSKQQELIEKCAKVMGYGNPRFLQWNPLKSVADAADMAIACKVDVMWYELSVKAVYSPEQSGIHVFAFSYFKDHPTEQAAYCWAVCQVVAQMEVPNNEVD